jgi:hypothetical protein
MRHSGDSVARVCGKLEYATVRAYLLRAPQCIEHFIDRLKRGCCCLPTGRRYARPLQGMYPAYLETSVAP